MTFARYLVLVGTVALIAVIDASLGQHSLAGPLEKDKRVAATPPRYEPELLPLPTTRKLSEVEKTYLDIYNILKQENSCSQFFGGPEAIEALNQLTQQIRLARLDRNIGMRMTGRTTSVRIHSTGFRYRLFGKAEVNINGPFFQGNSFAGTQTISSIGAFLPNTREARATLLLHELGHLIQKSDDQWVLPNDGNNPGRSEENTERVIQACGKQIRALNQFNFEEELQGQLKA